MAPEHSTVRSGAAVGPARSQYALASANPFRVFEVLWLHRSLIGRLARREILQRYRGSTFGMAWSFFHPLLMLGVFTFVFGYVLPGRSGHAVDSVSSFGLLLFSGLALLSLGRLLAERIFPAPRRT